jgi:hypothetical protein
VTRFAIKWYVATNTILLRLQDIRLTSLTQGQRRYRTCRVPS